MNSQHGILLHVYSSCNVKLNILGVSLLLKQKNNYAFMMSGCLLYSPPDERQNYIQMFFSLNEEKLSDIIILENILVWYNHVLCLKKDG